MAPKESFAGQSSILEPMKISSLLIDPPVCAPKSTVLPGSTQQLSDLSNQNSHFSKHNSRSHKYNDEELWFIWYQHVVLDQKWENILESFKEFDKCLGWVIVFLLRTVLIQPCSLQDTSDTDERHNGLILPVLEYRNSTCG